MVDIQVETNTWLYFMITRILFIIREEKTKFQDGRLYLTNCRLIYAANQSNDSPAALSLHLKHVRSVQLHGSFLKSPKITVYLFPKGHIEPLSQAKISKWICDQCTYHNSLTQTTCDMCNTLRSFTSQLTLSDSSQSTTIQSTQSVEMIYLKFSFKSGGQNTFFEQFQSVLERRAWQVGDKTYCRVSSYDSIY
jgi:hypothetical protein